MSDVASVEKNSADILAAQAYLDERKTPRARDLLFLSLTDLKAFVSQCAPEVEGEILDYGCGGSPYAELFTRAKRYVRADMLPGPGVDLVLPADGGTDEPAGAYHGIVSFQVLEHVREPDRYLTECHRILSPGGKLLLTTHGTFLEHKCPNDYYRWTSEGLEELVTSHGFEVIRSAKITTGLRAGIQLQHFLVHDFIHRQWTAGGTLLRAIRKVYRPTLQPLLNMFAGRFLRGESIQPADALANLYIGVGVLARRV